MADTAEPLPVLPPAPPAKTTSRTALILAALVVVAGVAIVAALIAYNSGTPTNDYTGLTPREAVAKWAANGGHDRGLAVDNATREFKTLPPNASPQLVRAVCVDTYQAAQAAFDYGPIPDGEAQAYWSGALAHLESYANWCINGIDANTDSSSYLARSDVSNYSKQLALFTARMNEILGPPMATAHVQRGPITTSGTVRIATALVVPNSAVILQGGNRWVNVPTPNGPARKQFTSGLTGDDNTEVLGGLYEGEEVLLPQATR